MEPGETLEEAVRREVHEEAGIRCGRVRYLAAQPWPFPSSLMMGFLAEALTEEITVDPEEIAEARWFHKDEMREMVAPRRDGPRRSDEGVAAGADRHRPPHLPPLGHRARRHLISGRRGSGPATTRACWWCQSSARVQIR